MLWLVKLMARITAAPRTMAHRVNKAREGRARRELNANLTRYSIELPPYSLRRSEARHRSAAAACPAQARWHVAAPMASIGAMGGGAAQRFGAFGRTTCRQPYNVLTMLPPFRSGVKSPYSVMQNAHDIPVWAQSLPGKTARGWVRPQLHGAALTNCTRSPIQSAGGKPRRTW